MIKDCLICKNNYFLLKNQEKGFEECFLINSI
jgi:hypothetical protein